MRRRKQVQLIEDLANLSICVVGATLTLEANSAETYAPWVVVAVTEDGMRYPLSGYARYPDLAVDDMRSIVIQHGSVNPRTYRQNPSIIAPR